MRRYGRPRPALALAALALALASAGTLAQQDLPPGPTVPFRTDFPDAHRYDVVQLVLDFAPGSWTPLHTHGGLAYVTVLAGEMTVREEGKEAQTYPTGGSWVEYPAVFAEVGNEGATDARILATFVLPEGAALTATHQAPATQDAPPGPTITHRSEFPDAAAVGAFDVIQIVLDFAPGAWTPMHTHGGEAIVAVLEGRMTVRMEGGDEQGYGAGEAWLEHPGAFAAVGNAGSEPATVAVTLLLPKGAELTTMR